MTLDTIRIIFVSRGKKFLATSLGFFEIVIWLFAIGQIMTHLTNIAYYMAYAGGFATGVFVGISIEEKIAVGTVGIRIITKKEPAELVEHIRSMGYGATCFEGEGSTGQVKLIYTAIRRRDVADVVGIIKMFNPKAFYSIEEIRSASKGVFPPVNPYYRFSLHAIRTLLIK